MGHFHQALKFDLVVKSAGVRFPFFVGCHCADSSASRDCKELVTETCFPSQAGHPQFLDARLAIVASHSWSGPLGHFHQTLNFDDPKVTSAGVRSPFFVGCHCAASSGWDSLSGTLAFVSVMEPLGFSDMTG